MRVARGLRDGWGGGSEGGGLMRYIVTVLIAGLLACSAWAEIINGSFETGDFTGWLTDEMRGYASVVPGGTDGGWKAQMALEGYYLDGPGGDDFAEGMVGVRQDLGVPLEAQFLVFDAWVQGSGVAYALLRFCGQSEITVAGSVPTTYAIRVMPAEAEVDEFYFTAWQTDAGDSFVYLDNVRFSDIPEPATLVLLGCGLGGVIPLIRRQKR